MASKVSQNGIDLIKEFEGLRLVPYECAGKKWTIGYGHTKGVGPTMTPISKEYAEELLKQDLVEAEEAIGRLVKVPLNQNQFDALASWVFNLGEGNLRRSTLLKKLNMGEYHEVPYELMRWNKANNKPLNGLTRRRAAEAKLWSTDSVESVTLEPEVLPEDVKRDVPSIINKENIGFGAGIASTVGLSSIASGEGPIQYAFAIIMVIGFGVGLYLFFRRRGA